MWQVTMFLLSLLICWVVPALLVVHQRHPLPLYNISVEFLGSFLFKFLVACTTLLAFHHGLPPRTATAMTLIVIWLGIVWIGFASGGHLNSAVTIGIWASGQLPILHAVLYIAAQLVGCALAMDAVRFATPLHLHIAVAPAQPSNPEQYVSTVMLEMFFSTLNILLALGGGSLGKYQDIVTASMVLVFILAAKPFGGASMDPSGAL